MSYRIGPEFFEFVHELRAKRGLATVNVCYDDKEVFDAIQWWLAHRLGRPVTQWEVFSFLVGEALSNKGSELYSAKIFPEEQEERLSRRPVGMR